MRNILIGVGIALLVLGFGTFAFLKMSLPGGTSGASGDYSFDMAELMKGSTALTLEQGASGLEYDSLIGPEAPARYRRVLGSELDLFKRLGTGDEAAFTARIAAAADSLADLMVNEGVIGNVTLFFRVANLEFGRRHPIGLAERTVDQWVAGHLTAGQRLDMVRRHVELYTDTKRFGDGSYGTGGNSEDDKKIYTAVRATLLADIAAVGARPGLSPEEYAALTARALPGFDAMDIKPGGGRNLTLVTLIPKTYYDMARVLGTTAAVEDTLRAWYARQTHYTPPGFGELADNARKYVSFMKEAGLVGESGCRRIENILNEDFVLFRNSADTALLARTAIESLERLEREAGDTEDREFFAGLYYDMARNKGLDIGWRIDRWMYGPGDPEVNAEYAARMPWDRR